MTSAKTIGAAVYRIAEEPGWEWTGIWWRLGCIIIAAGGRTWEARSPEDPCPGDVEAFGCSGWSLRGPFRRGADGRVRGEGTLLHWFGLDLDVGHGGANAYGSTEEAIQAARKVRNALGGQAEIRLSRSGRGVHVRHLLPASAWGRFSKEDGPRFAKGLAAKLGIKTDPTVLGRQAFWLWARDPGPGGFTAVEEQP